MVNEQDVGRGSNTDICIVKSKMMQSFVPFENGQIYLRSCLKKKTKVNKREEIARDQG